MRPTKSTKSSNFQINLYDTKGIYKNHQEVGSHYMHNGYAKVMSSNVVIVSSRLSSQPYLLSDFEKNAWYIDFSLSLFWQQANIQVCTDVWTKFIQDASVWSDPLNIFHALFLISKFIKMNSLEQKCLFGVIHFRIMFHLKNGQCIKWK